MSMQLGPYSATAGQIAGVMDSIASTDPRFASQSPSLAVDAASSPDPSTTALTLAHADSVTSAQDAVASQQQSNSGVFGWLHDHGLNPVATGLSWLAKPLQEVSDDYKFVHAVFTQYGVGAGVLATLGVAGGVAAGTFLGQPLLGGVAALEVERQLLGRTLWQNAAKLANDPNYQVSFGRDLSNLIQLHNTNAGWGKILSGTADAAFDFAVDPLAIAGRAAAGLRAGKTLEGVDVTDETGNVVARRVGSTVPAAAMFPSVDRFLQSASLRAFSPDQIDAVYHGSPLLSSATRTYHRALGDLAGKDAAGVAVAYPALAPLAAKIGAAGTEADVHQVIRDTIFSADHVNSINGAAVLPSRSLAGGSVQTIRDSITKWGDAPKSQQANWLLPKRTEEGLVLPAVVNPLNIPGAAAKTIRTWTGRKPYVITPGLDKVSSSKGVLTDPGAYNAIYQMFRFGMGDAEAKEQLGNYINAVTESGAPDLASRRALIDAGQLQTLKAMGLPNDPQLLMDVRDALAKGSNGWSMGSAHRAYGYGHTLGDDVSTAETGNGVSPVALHPWQDDRSFTFLDFHAAQRAVRDLHKASGVYGALDDGLRKHFIEAVFKPLALFTGGFAQRIAVGESLQAMFRYGSVNTAKSVIQSAALHLGYRLRAGEEDHLLAAAQEPLMAGSAQLPAATPDEIRAVHAYAEAGSPLPSLDGTDPDLLAQANGYGQRVMSALSSSAFKVANTVNPERLELAAKLIIRGQGHMGTGPVLTGHGAGFSDVDSAGIANEAVWSQGSRHAKLKGQDYWRGKLAWKPSANNFGVYEPESIKFPLYWKGAADHAARDTQSVLITKDVLRHLDDGISPDVAWRRAVDADAARIAGHAHDPTAPDGMGAPLPKGEDPYAAWRGDMARTLMEDPQLHAYKVADDLRNTMTGRDGTFHRDVADAIAKQEKLPIDHYVTKDPLTRPKGVAGPEWEPYTGGNLLKRFVEAGYTKGIDPIINHLSRNPLMLMATERELKSVQWAVDNGTMDSERALSIAIHRATHAILPQIHNTSNRSQFALAATNFLPFFFAQEQAYRRAGRLIQENPAALRYYQMIEGGLASAVTTHKDGSGNQSVTLPFVGAWGQHAVAALSAMGVPIEAGLPMDATGSLTSLKSVLPEGNLPGTSPMVGVAANELTNLVPGLTPVMSALVGSQSIHQSLIDQMIPNSPARTFIQGMTLNESDTAVHAAVLNALASAYYHGAFPPASATGIQRQAFMDRIYNNVRSALMLKAVLGVLSPIAPQVSVGDPGFRDEFSALVTKTGDYAKALDAFTKEHGDRAISYTIGQTQPTGAKIPETNAALSWVDANGDLIAGPYGTGAAFLVPQDKSGGNTQVINDQLLKMGLRERRTPDQFMDAVYVSAGNNLLDGPIRVHQANQAKYASDPAALNYENQAWSSWVQKQRIANPLWYDNYTSDARRTLALQGLSDLLNIRQKGLADASDPHVGSIYALLGDFVKHSQMQAQLHASSASGQIGAERNAWTGYLDGLAGYTDPATGKDVPGSRPDLATVIRTLFLPLAAQNIDLSNLGA